MTLPGTGQNATPKKDHNPGWPGAFPDITNYQRTMDAAEMTKDKKAYRQKANYLWLGGRLEDNYVTLARGHAYIKDVTGAALLKDAESPELIKLDGFTGWQWKDKKLVVMLANDRILVIEAKFEGNDLRAFAGKFPLKACAKALDHPPRD
jgi:hypothetical protein